LGELYRLRGEYDAAEGAYRQASRNGRRTEPGLALIWMARGQLDAAVAAVERCLDENRGNRPVCVDLLRAQVEMLLARDDLAGARLAASELAAQAAVLNAPMLLAAAERAIGWVLVAEGSPRESLGPLRRAWMAWQQLEAPFEAARERVQIGLALRALGDLSSAEMEFDAARWVFHELGAVPALAALDALSPPVSRESSTRQLTVREEQVLRLIAAGYTNRRIASELVISEHTVARHVQNMLNKLGFSSRSRLAAFAVERRGPASQT
jgi:DNA-binding CsgD family transcriptional regulator